MTTLAAPPMTDSWRKALRLSLLESAKQLLELEASIRHGLPLTSLEQLRPKVLLVNLVVDALHPTALVPPTLAALDPDAILREKFAQVVAAVRSQPSPTSRQGKRG